MKIKSFDHALPYFFAQPVRSRDSGNLPELEKSNGLLENILRWEDDGGRIIETRQSMPDRKRKNING